MSTKGEVQFDVREAKPRTAQLLPNWYADCRFKGYTTVGEDIRYSMDEILEKWGRGKTMTVDGVMRNLRLEL